VLYKLFSGCSLNMKVPDEFCCCPDSLGLISDIDNKAAGMYATPRHDSTA